MFSFIHIVMAFISREKIGSEKVQHGAPLTEVWRGQKLFGQCPQIRSAFQRGVSLRTALSGFNAERNFTNFLLQASVVIIFNNEVIHCDFYAKAAHSFWKRCSPLYCGPFGVFWTELPGNFYTRWAIRNILLTCKRRALIMKKNDSFWTLSKVLSPACEQFSVEFDYNF